MATPSATPEAAVQVKRTIAAPREKVFEAWVNPKLMAQWFTRAKNNPEVRVIEADARAGGKYLVETPCEGKLFRIQGTYRVVRPPEKLVFTWWWEGADFEQSLVTVEFRALGKSAFTELTLTHEQLPATQREEHRKGWEGCLDLLETAVQAPANG